MKLSEIKDKILPKITPMHSEINKINNIISIIISELEKEAKLNSIAYNHIEPQGSTGIKQTNLSGTSDIDLFFLLDPNKYQEILDMPKKEKKKSLSGLFKELSINWVMKALKNIGCSDIKLSYAEHPYVSASYDGFSIDVAGCFELSLNTLKNNGPITAIDRTPHHSNFINKNLSKNEKNEVRLLKAFFKSAKIYGDKSFMDKMGFTGFACELFIYYYKKIEKVFEKIRDSENIIIDYFQRKDDEIKNQPKFENQSIIIIDPTDPERNVTASISEKIFQFSKFMINKFYEKPTSDFFIEKAIEIKSNKEFDPFLDNVVFIELEIYNQDVHYTLIRDKLYVVAEKIRKSFQKPEYLDIKDFFYSIIYDKINASIIFYFKNGRCFEKKYFKMGPPLYLKDSLQDFKVKNPKVFEKNGRLWAHLNRKFHNAIDFIKSIIKKEDFKYFNINEIGKIPKLKLSKQNFSFLIEELIPFYFENNHVKK
ncbi:MAG: hypothetical protein EAX96_14490 [Candidatus Lokiarchaeota archaeon]|nr:hypothetical protein [Candidatus Lokiarchaeota archaeon]